MASKRKQIIAEVVGTPKPFELCEKRFYVPGYVIKATCACGRELKTDLGDHYLSYPKANEKTVCRLYCEEWVGDKDVGCGATVEVPIIVNVSVSLAR